VARAGCAARRKWPPCLLLRRGPSMSTKRGPSPDVNPMADKPLPWLGAKPRQRNWFKGDKADELIRKLWHVATQLGGDRERFIKLVLILGKRRGAASAPPLDRRRVAGRTLQRRSKRLRTHAPS
jgi:hypothetical protein